MARARGWVGQRTLGLEINQARSQQMDRPQAKSVDDTKDEFRLGSIERTAEVVGYADWWLVRQGTERALVTDQNWLIEPSGNRAVC